MLLNDGIVGIEKSDGICSPIFAVDEFSGFFLHPLFFHLFNYTLKICINKKWFFNRFLILIKVFNVFRRHN